MELCTRPHCTRDAALGSSLCVRHAADEQYLQQARAEDAEEAALLARKAAQQGGSTSTSGARISSHERGREAVADNVEKILNGEIGLENEPPRRKVLPLTRETVGDLIDRLMSGEDIDGPEAA